MKISHYFLSWKNRRMSTVWKKISPASKLFKTQYQINQNTFYELWAMESHFNQIHCENGEIRCISLCFSNKIGITAIYLIFYQEAFEILIINFLIIAKPSKMKLVLVCTKANLKISTPTTPSLGSHQTNLFYATSGINLSF